MSTSACHACGTVGLIAVEAPGWRGVTSDVRPWPRLPELGVCRSCGLAQKIADPRFRLDTAAIYAGYEIYHQAAGAEQLVFEGATGTPRSARLAAALRDAAPLPETGRLLDVGCGNGAFLRAFGALFPAWRMTGSELDDRNRTVVEAIPGVETFHAGDVDRVSGMFNLVTLVHVLEHVPHPRALLAALREKLARGGRLVTQVPDLRANPFDLVVADHVSHFTVETLVRVLGDAGLATALAPARWVPREITAVAVPDGEAGSAPRATDASVALVTGAIRWLSDLLEGARAAAAGRQFGIFGTSVGATWLAAHLEDETRFFVDEDPQRIGRTHMGRPILAPASVPAGAAVFLALATDTALRVAERLVGARFMVVPPPAWHPPTPARTASP